VRHCSEVSVSRKKASEPSGYLFGLPVLTPEWQARRDDARQQEIEKTQALRAARLAAQARVRKAPATDKSKIVPVSQARRAAPEAAE
jgi:hypothetical protein